MQITIWLYPIRCGLQDLSCEWRKPTATLSAMGVPVLYPALQILLRVDAAAAGMVTSEFLFLNFLGVWLIEDKKETR